jgi:predicted phage-related endonuclease
VLGVLQDRVPAAHLDAVAAGELAGDDVLEERPPQCGLAVTGRQWGYVAALIGGNDYRQRLVERDDELLDALIAAEAAFWQRVVDGDPPLPDGADSTTEAIAQLYADARPGSAVDLPVTAEELVAVYNGAAEAEKRAKAAKAEAANQLRALLGDAELGFVEGDDRPLVSWKNQPHRELDRKALAAEHPELVERFTTTTTRRVLRPRKA